MSFSWEHGTGYYVPVCGPAESLLLPCDDVHRGAQADPLKTRTIKKVGHNIKYDLLVMRQTRHRRARRRAGLDDRRVPARRAAGCSTASTGWRWTC